MSRVSRDARLLFIMLWTIADDAGRARAASRLLASLLFPYDNDAPQKIPEWLMELERQNVIKVYAVDGNSYLEITNWLDHQKIDRPSPSRLPAYVPKRKPREKTSEAREDSRDIVEDSATDLVPRTLDQEGTISRSPQAAPRVKSIPKNSLNGHQKDFDLFWNAYPRRVDKADAVRAYVKALARASPEQLLAGAQAYAVKRRDEDEKFTKHAETWLNADSWLDEDMPEIIDPEKAAEARDKADQILKRGKYAEPN